MNKKRKTKSHTGPGRGKKRWYTRTPEILLDSEIDLLLDEAMKSCFRDYTLIFFTLNTGLRNSEVIGLNISNVYIFNEVPKVLELPATISKGKKPRIIPLNTDIRSILDVYIENEFSSGKITDENCPLFRTKYTNIRLCSRDFQQILEKHARNSIKRRCYPHMLRHTFATKLLRQSNIKIVQDILGHSCIQSTQIYLHPSSSDKIDAVNKLKFGIKTLLNMIERRI